MSDFETQDGRKDETPDPRPAPRDDAAAVDSGGVLRPNGLEPGVAGSSLGGASLWGVGGGAVLLGMLAFLWLSSHRAHPPGDPGAQTVGSTAAAGSAPAAPPSDIVAMEAAARAAHATPPPAAPIVQPVALPPPPLRAAAVPQAPAPAAPSQNRSPVLVVDLADAAAASTTAGAAKDGTGPGKGEHAAPTGLSADEQFAARVEGGSLPDRARATVLRDKSRVVAQGAMIPAVLETALDSDLPGFARAVVSRDVRSFDGLAVLIPRGSRVIGEYRPATALGQSRAFVIWTRVLRPDGVSVQIGSPATDPLGRAGLSGAVDNHFFERFSGAILLSVVNAGATALAGAPATEVVIGSSQDASGVAAAASAFAPANIAPTIRVPQGAPIRIFVARDLEFTNIGAP